MVRMKASSLFCRIGMVIVWITVLLAVMAAITAFTGFPGFKKFPLSLLELIGLALAGAGFYLLGQLTDPSRHRRRGRLTGHKENESK